MTKNPHTQPIALRLVDAAPIIGKGRTALFAAARSSKLKLRTYKDGRARMVTYEALEEYVRALEAGPFALEADDANPARGASK